MGRFLMLFRTKIGVLYASASYDEGITWVATRIDGNTKPRFKNRLDSITLGRLSDGYKRARETKRTETARADFSRCCCLRRWRRNLAEDRKVGRRSQSPLVRSHYPTAVEAYREGGTRLLIIYSKFYFGLGGLEQAIQEKRPMGIRLQSVSLK